MDMGVAAWLVRRRHPPQAVAVPLTLFVVQLALNLGWTIVFFGLESPGGAVVEIAVLLVFITATVVTFARVSRVPAAMLLPYLAWTGFAAALILAIALEN